MISTKLKNRFTELTPLNGFIINRKPNNDFIIEYNKTLIEKFLVMHKVETKINTEQYLISEINSYFLYLVSLLGILFCSISYYGIAIEMNNYKLGYVFIGFAFAVIIVLRLIMNYFKEKEHKYLLELV